MAISTNSCTEGVLQFMGVWNGECFEPSNINFSQFAMFSFSPIFGISDYVAIQNQTHMFIWKDDEWQLHELPFVLQYAGGNSVLRNDLLFLENEDTYCCAWGIFNISSSTWILSNTSMIPLDVNSGYVWGTEFFESLPYYPKYFVKQDIITLEETQYPFPGILSTPDVPDSEEENEKSVFFSSGQLYFVDYNSGFVNKWNGSHGWEIFPMPSSTSGFLFVANLTHMFALTGNGTNCWLDIYSENVHVSRITLSMSILVDNPVDWFLTSDALILEAYENNNNVIDIVDLRTGVVETILPRLSEVSAIYSDGVYMYLGGDPESTGNSSIVKYCLENR